MYSQQYVQALSIGPFPDQIDPWAESARYFHQIHGSMIGDLLERLRLPLLGLGYIAARETSLQIAERTQPDISIRNRRSSNPRETKWDYATAAAAAMVEPGIVIEDVTPELEAVYITRMGGELVTVIEVVSPGNKDLLADMEFYQQRRERLVKDQGINVVELDLTRSVKRLIRDLTVMSYPYHLALHLPDDTRLIGLEYGQPLKSFALPLHNEVIVVDTQAVYRAAYQQASIAAQIEEGKGYSEDKLPFPSLLTLNQRRDAIKTVNEWQASLERLRLEKNG